jgi:menaquinone-dependent protoporphyrinogen oxidase
LAGRALAVDLLDLADAPGAAEVAADHDLVAVIAAVRYGKHLPAADAFLAAWRRLPSPPPPLALATVNLTARKPNKQTLETNPYLKKLIARHELAPVVTGIFAGRLDYPRYRWFDRQMIRLIMALTGGPTDAKAQVDYTSWPGVDAFADAVAGAAEGVSSPAA